MCVRGIHLGEGIGPKEIFLGAVGVIYFLGIWVLNSTFIKRS